MPPRGTRAIVVDEPGKADLYDTPLDEGLNRYHEASERALARVMDQGLRPHDTRPKMGNQYFDGRLPPHWASMNSQQIGELFEMMTAHADFLGAKATLAKAEKTNAEERLRLVKAKVRKSKMGNNDDKDDSTVCDSRYVEANAQWLEATEYYEIINGMVEAASRDLRILSRHLETKKMEMEGGRRATGIGNGRNPFARP